MSGFVQEHAASESALDFVSAWRLCWKNRFLIAGIALLLGVVTAAGSLVMTPMYRAEVVLTPVNTDGLGGGVSGLGGQLGGLASLAGVNLFAPGGDALQNQAYLFSRSLATQFVHDADLTPVLLPDPSKPSTLWSAVERFREGVLRIREDKLKGTLTVAIEWTDPAVAADWANRYVALANEILRQRAVDNGNRNISYLNEQLAKTNVVEMQRALYNIIENETKTLMLANARHEFAFRVVDPAVKPELRFRPKRSVMVIVALLIGGLLAIFAVFVRDAFVRRASEPMQVGDRA